VPLGGIRRRLRQPMPTRIERVAGEQRRREDKP
jgi:hypothetical protein